jgi:hypothetical protein
MLSVLLTFRFCSEVLYRTVSQHLFLHVPMQCLHVSDMGLIGERRDVHVYYVHTDVKSVVYYLYSKHIFT